MARDAEKARSMLHRFLSQKAEAEGDGTSIRGSGIGGPKRVQRRPYLASLVEDVGDAQRWRRQLVGEIGTKMLEIQNPSLPHEEVRTLNAALNALFREKRHWDRRVVQLGGPPPDPAPPPRTTTAAAADGTDAAAAAAASSSTPLRLGDTTYYGAARALPEVVAAAAADARRRTRRAARAAAAAELLAAAGGLTAGYYGYGPLPGDEDEAEVVVAAPADADRAAGDDGGGDGDGGTPMAPWEAEERAAEAAAVAAAADDWERAHPGGRGERTDDAGADDGGDGWDVAALDAAAARRVAALRLAQRKRQALERLS